MQDRNVLLLARDYVEDREPIDEAILELFERLEEHDVVGGAIAVEQEELAVRLARKRALDDRQDRRDAGAGGKADMDTPGAGRRDHTKASRGRHHVQRVAALQIVRCPARKRATINPLDGDAYLTVVGPGADRIGAAHFLTIQHGAEREVLAGREGVVGRKLRRDGECQRYGVRRLAAEVVDGQAMEAWCGC
ncbi:hypothetical protein ACVIN2_001789 [Bradyrhizobium sp. USDA 3650]